MKKLLLISFVIITFLGNVSLDAQSVSKTAARATVASKIEVYYFHYTRRCRTCESVEKNAKLAVESLYADKIKKGEVVFVGINLDDASSKALAEKLSVGGQSLLVVYGDKKEDITDKGFMNAQNVDKLKVVIKSAVENVLKK